MYKFIVFAIFASLLIITEAKPRGQQVRMRVYGSSVPVSGGQNNEPHQGILLKFSIYIKLIFYKSF